MSHRLLIWVAAIAGVVVVALVAVGVAVLVTPHKPTGTTLRVQLVRPNGDKVTDLDGTVAIDLSGTVNQYYRYAGTAYKKNAGKDYAGDIVAGVAMFTHLPKGIWVVSLDAPHAFQYSIRNELKPKTNQTMDVNLVVARGGTIDGRVLLPTKKPAVGLTVGAVDSTGRIVHRSTTDAKGDYHLSGLDAGSWRVIFNGKAFGDVKPAGSYAWNYWHGAGTFASGGILHIRSETKTHRESRVTDIDGVLTAGALVTVNRWTNGPLSDYDHDTIDFLGGHSADYVQSTLVDGRTTTTRLAPGSYLLRVIRPGETSLDNTVYWYAGENKPPVRKKSEAVALVVPATGAITVNFGRSPSGPQKTSLN